MKAKKPKKRATRPGEFVAFFNLEMATKEGVAYVYLACDAFSEFGFNTGVERSEAPEIVLKHIYLLTEHPDFVRHRDKGFTLVLGKFGELEERMNAIIKPVNGRLLFDEGFHNIIAAPIVNSFGSFNI